MVLFPQHNTVYNKNLRLDTQDSSELRVVKNNGNCFFFIIDENPLASRMSCVSTAHFHSHQHPRRGRNDNVNENEDGIRACLSTNMQPAQIISKHINANSQPMKMLYRCTTFFADIPAPSSSLIMANAHKGPQRPVPRYSMLFNPLTPQNSA